MAKRQSLNPLREQLSILVERANAQVKAINKAHKKSRAVDEAKRTLVNQRSRKKDKNLFRSDLKTRKEINREFARVQAFLGDYTSTVEGAKKWKSDLTDLRGAFGGQWEATNGHHYDSSRIDDETAKKAFDMYKRIIEAAGGWERAVGFAQNKESLIGYGSETLITNIYDMFVNKVYEIDENGEKNYERAIFNRAMDMVTKGMNMYEEMSKRQVSGYDYGALFDDEDAVSRRNFYSWRRKYREGI